VLIMRSAGSCRWTLRARESAVHPSRPPYLTSSTRHPRSLNSGHCMHLPHPDPVNTTFSSSKRRLEKQSCMGAHQQLRQELLGYQQIFFTWPAVVGFSRTSVMYPTYAWFVIVTTRRRGAAACKCGATCPSHASGSTSELCASYRSLRRTEHLRRSAGKKIRPAGALTSVSARSAESTGDASHSRCIGAMVKCASRPRSAHRSTRTHCAVRFSSTSDCRHGSGGEAVHPSTRKPAIILVMLTREMCRMFCAAARTAWSRGAEQVVCLEPVDMGEGKQRRQWSGRGDAGVFSAPRDLKLNEHLDVRALSQHEQTRPMKPAACQGMTIQEQVKNRPCHYMYIQEPL
jgi:hypothetical protein